MNKEQTELLFKDLCARLPYKVYAQIPDEHGGYTSAIENVDIDGFVIDFEGAQTEIENIKPYLLPLSSMTEKQKSEYHDNCNVGLNRWGNEVYYDCAESIDWLNSHHFDYRGLIPMGLANDATGLNIY